jgi:hypothetical protein
MDEALDMTTATGSAEATLGRLTARATDTTATATDFIMVLMYQNLKRTDS